IRDFHVTGVQTCALPILMSAGTGVRHSEYNASAIDTVGFLQIWIIPDREGYEPRYAQKDFSASTGITLVVSPDGRDDSLAIRQRSEERRVGKEGRGQAAR